MHDLTIQQRFVELRGQSWTFSRIATELNVSKKTLIDWSRKYQFEVQNARAVEMEALREELLTSQEVRLRTLGEQLRRIEEELKTRSLAEVSTGKLFSLADAVRQRIVRETGEIRFTMPIQDIPPKEYRDEVQDWKP